MSRMNQQQFRKLRMKINKRYRKSLDLDYMDVIGLADVVAWGESTEEELFAKLDEAVLDGSMEKS